jgi:hypothetical protein
MTQQTAQYLLKSLNKAQQGLFLFLLFVLIAEEEIISMTQQTAQYC